MQRSLLLLALRKQYEKLSRLNILDHGNKQGIQIGKDWLTTSTLSRYEVFLRRLRGQFDKGGFVHFQHCEAGQNKPLLLAMAKVLNAPVYAGTGLHNPLYRVNLGEYVRADPNGRFQTDVSRP